MPTQGDGPIVRCAGVTKCYQPDQPDVLALRGVDVEVAAGELVAIMGPSGCGKSTLLHMIGGLDTPTSGSVEVAGERIDQLSEAKRAVLRRRLVGYVFQFFNLVANLSVRDNVELPMLLVGAAPAAASARRETLLAELGLSEHAAKAPSELSGGQQQRVALARALANEPALLLADEPTGNLDTAAAGDVLDLLRRQHERGQTIVMVTHDPKVASAADRVVLMRDGVVETEIHPREEGIDRLVAGLLQRSP
jgi:putative ABC transport system ATP-binding protein